MTERDPNQELRKLMDKIKMLSPRRFAAVEAFVDGYANAVDIDLNPDSDVITEDFSEAFGDVLRLHHTVSSEPFTKDKFEYAMVSLLNELEHDARKAPAGNPGRDLEVDGAGWSLKTQADRSIRSGEIHGHVPSSGVRRWRIILA